MKNLLLIGMPGAGKSTIGIVLAKTLGMSFIDTDLVIQDKEKRLLQEIINTEGIERFLEIEEKALLAIKCQNTVIATGGSAIYSSKAIDTLRETSLSIYLELDLTEIEKRINNITTRGIVLAKGQSLQDIYNIRKELYEKHADITIHCEGKRDEEIVREIKSLISN